MKDIRIDNVGFDGDAMAAMSTKDFVDTHMSNDAICKGKTEAEKIEWLQNAHAAIVKAVNPAKEKPVSK